MSASPSTIMADRPHLNLLEKAATVGSWGLAGAIFLTVGWLAVQPEDPLGAVSVIGQHGALVVFIQAAALAGVAAALATVIAGRTLADVGTFAAAVGLAVVSLRGGTVETLLVRFADSSASTQRTLALGFALESIGWFAVLAVAMGVSAAVMRWCFPGPNKPEENNDVKSVAARTMAGYDVPGMGPGLFGRPAERQTALSVGMMHTAMATGLSLLFMGVLSAGLSSRSIQHGQSCFVVAAGVYLGSRLAYRFAPTRSSLWSVLAVPLIALLAYGWASLRPPGPSLPPIFPSSHYLRVLPIQYISVGTAAALTMFWYAYQGEPRTEEHRRPRGAKSPRGGGS